MKACYHGQGSQLWLPRRTVPQGTTFSPANAGGRVVPPKHLQISAVLGQGNTRKRILKGVGLNTWCWANLKGVYVPSGFKLGLLMELCEANFLLTCSTSSCEHPHKNRRSWQPHVTEAAIKLWDRKAQGQGFNLVHLAACAIDGWLVSNSCVAFLPVQSREFGKVSPDWI